MPRKRSGRGRARLALVLRLLGATGLFVALLGLIPLATDLDLTSTSAWESALSEYGSELPMIRFDSYRDTGLTMLFAGGTVFVFSAVVLALAGLRTFAGRHNA